MESLAADCILVAHCLFIAFVIGGQAVILAGAWRRWAWVRRRGFRIAHIAAIAVVAAQAWLGMACPLTLWENNLRQAAGESLYPGTFVGYWLSRLIYFEAPPWVFTAAYTLFGVMVLASWFIVKPRRQADDAPL
jgi:hypothetical protein